mmetsp:Transcript_14697/g.39114  ORF Transcript_14697/g.39114 Transcript_14697/m.39114 type:complete len:81 (+) Transcript_14697:126-368(+)
MRESGTNRGPEEGSLILKDGSTHAQQFLKSIAADATHGRTAASARKRQMCMSPRAQNDKGCDDIEEYPEIEECPDIGVYT